MLIDWGKNDIDKQLMAEKFDLVSSIGQSFAWAETFVVPFAKPLRVQMGLEEFSILQN